MTFEIEIRGRTRAVSVERAGPGRYRVVVDGVEHMVGASRADEFGLSIILDGERARSREVQLAPSSVRGELLALLEGRTMPVGMNGRRRRQRAGDPAHATASQSILAPMPGRVVRVLVGPGDDVAARQPLVVVEAMKMENELRAPRAGTVTEVTVEAGMSVEAGRVLVTLK